MSIIVVGDSKKRFRKEADEGLRTKFLVDKPHDGDNIDKLNPWFCELTGLYYMWRHDDGDIVGLEHYRRYLSTNGRTPITEDDIRKKLSVGDVICSIVRYGHHPIKSYFSARGNDFYSWLLRYLLWLDCADPALGAVTRSYMEGRQHVLGNIFIAKKELLDEYAGSLFKNLLEFHECEKVHGRWIVPRIFGYLSEFTFGAWLEYRRKKRVEVGICWN